MHRRAIAAVVLVVACVFVAFPARCDAQLPNASSANTPTPTPPPTPPPPPPSALDADAGSAGLLLLQLVANIHVIEGHFDAPRRRLYQAAIAVVLEVPPNQVLIAREEPIAHQERRADTQTLAVFTEVYVRTRAPFPLLETEILNSLLASSRFQVTSIAGVTVTDLPRDYNGTYTITSRGAARSTLA